MDKVVVKRGELNEIARMVGATKQTVINALNFRHESKLADQIRTVAIQRGGRLMTDKK